MPELFELGSHALITAHSLAVASGMAYDDEPQKDPLFASLRLKPESVRLLTSPQTNQRRGFVASNDKHVVVAFRGTDDPVDGLLNVTAVPVDGFGGKVHAGFRVVFQSVWREGLPDSLVSLIRAQRTNGQKLWITGHSLGGAVATLVTASLPADLVPAGTITFGQPRVGDAGFAGHFTRELTRYVTLHDPVAKLPVTGSQLQYQHVGQSFLLGDDGVLIPGGNEASLATDLISLGLSLFTAFDQPQADFAASLHNVASPHRIANYIDRLKVLCAPLVT